MENLNINDHTRFMDLTYDIRSHIYNFVENDEFSSVLPFQQRRTETQERLSTARQREIEARQQFNLNPTSETNLDLIEARTEREEARMGYVEADRELNRMVDLIASRVRIQERILRMRNELPFR